VSNTEIDLYKDVKTSIDARLRVNFISTYKKIKNGTFPYFPW